MKKVHSFTDLLAWREAHKLALSVYQITSHFPKDAYSLVDQIRRSSTSVGANIAEGFSRQHIKEKIQFFTIGLGSLTETQSFLIFARDIHYMPKALFDTTAAQTVIVSKLLNGLIKSTRVQNEHLQQHIISNS